MLIGGLVVLALYVIPGVGFIVYKLLDLIGLGIVAYALLAHAQFVSLIVAGLGFS